MKAGPHDPSGFLGFKQMVSKKVNIVCVYVCESTCVYMLAHCVCLQVSAGEFGSSAEGASLSGSSAEVVWRPV